VRHVQRAPEERCHWVGSQNAMGVSLFNRFLAWREARRRRLYRQWLRRSRVILPTPDPRCQRNSVEAVP
jgi:hypothetical protein